MSTTINIAASLTKSLNEHGIGWMLVAGSAGLVRLHAARNGFLPANPASPYGIGAHTLTFEELGDEYAGQPDDPWSVKLTPDGHTKLKVSSLVVVPVRSLSGAAQTTEIEEVSTWRLNEVFALTERWLARVVAVEAEQAARDEELRDAQAAQQATSKRWTTDFDEMVQQFYVRIEGTDIVLGAFYSTEEKAQQVADQMNAREAAKREASA